MWDIERIEEKHDLTGWNAVLVRGDQRKTVSLELTMGTAVSAHRAQETAEGLAARERIPDRVTFHPSGATTESTQVSQ